jgi:hypothetical protein
MGKLTPSYRNVLIELVTTPHAFTAASCLPDGNGLAGRASDLKLRNMMAAGLIEFGTTGGQSFYGYRITEAGRAALTSEQKR